MREIKFRGKRIDNENWVYGQYFITPLTDENSGLPPESGWSFLAGERKHCIARESVSFVIVPETVGQYAGMKDKNGKEIYEGDILRYSYDGRETIDVIVYSPPMFTYSKCMRWSLHQDEVIGNIYDNKELLILEKQKEDDIFNLLQGMNELMR